jgi:hypothetical protein
MVKWERKVDEEDGSEWWDGSSHFGRMINGFFGENSYALAVCRNDGGWFVRVHVLHTDDFYVSPGPHPTADAAKRECESWDMDAEDRVDMALLALLGGVTPDYQTMAPRRKGWKPS